MFRSTEASASAGVPAGLLGLVLSALLAGAASAQEPPVRATLVLTPAAISENGGVSTVTATLDGESGADTTLTVSVTPVSPATAADFTLSADPVLTIAAGNTTSTGTVTITAVDNNAEAAHKEFTVAATIAGNDGVAAPSGVTLTIRNDDGGICGRTLQVQTGILALLETRSDCKDVTAADLSGITGRLDLGSKGITSIRAGDFAGLSSLEELTLDRNSLTTLPSGLLAGLSSLKFLAVSRNDLTALPSDLLNGLSNLEELWLERNEITAFPPGFFIGQGDFTELHTDRNTGDRDLEPRDWSWNIPGSPVRLDVSLEAVAEGQFKVVAPSGVPFDMDFSVTVTNGIISGGDNTLTVNGGETESSETATVTRAEGTSGAVTADITDVPHHTDRGWSPYNNGFLPARDADDLPLEVFPARKPLVSIAPKADGVAVFEGTAAEFILTRDTPHDDALTVTVEVAQTGAVIKTADSYEPPDSVDFGAGEGTATLTVETQADSVDEPGGTITATVTAAETDDYAAGSPAEAEVTVQDDDKTTATVDSVSLSSDPGTDDTYAIGDAVKVTVTFATGSSGPVTVTGTPQLEITVGTATLTAIYESGSESNDLVFAYTVAEDDAAPGGIAVPANALSLNGGTIGIGEDAAVLTHAAVAADPAHKVDGVRPTIVSGTSSEDGTSLTLTYGETLDTARAPAGRGFTVTVDGRGRALGGAPTVSSTEVTLPLKAAVTYGQPIAVSYATPSAEDEPPAAVYDVVGNAAASADSQPVTNHAAENRIALSSYAGRDRTYAIGDVIEVTRRFLSAATVSGTPRLDLTIGDATRPAGYARGSGTRTLVFAYTVAEGDADADGVSIAQDALSLNGGSIRVGGDDARLVQGAVAAQARHKVDAVRPVFASAETSADGRSVTITFDKTLGEANEPSAAPYRVYVDGESLGALTGDVAVSGAEATLDLPATLTAGQAIQVELPANAIYEPVRDLVGNAVAAFEKQTATNSAGDNAGPRLKMAVLDKGVLTLTWDEALDAANPPPLGAFAVSVDGVGATLTGAPAVSGARLTLTLASAPTAGRRVTVSYTDPSAADDAAAVQDADGNDAASVADQPVMRLKRVTIVATPATITESGEATVTAALDAPASAAFTVAISATPGANAQASDYTLSAARTLSFASGATESTGTVTITAADDTRTTTWSGRCG